MTKVFLGIDPGQTGAIAAIICTGDKERLEFYDPNLFDVKSGKKVKHEYDVHDMALALRGMITKDPTDTEAFVYSCCLEKVSAMPGQGVSSMFNFGMGYGIWQGILGSLGIPFTLVSPVTWKGKIMMGMGKEKEAALVRCAQLYPDSFDALNKNPKTGRDKKQIGRADALLIAHYNKVFNPNGI